MEDEWLVVYLLSEISKQLPHLLIRCASGSFKGLIYVGRGQGPELGAILLHAILHVYSNCMQIEAYHVRCCFVVVST